MLHYIENNQNCLRFFFTLFKRILINWIECKTSETLKQGWILILSPDPSTGKPLTRVFHSA